MKRKFLLILWSTCFFSHMLFSQNLDLNYRMETSALFLGKKPIPPWIEVVIDPAHEDRQYNFIPIFSLPFQVWGWKEIDQKIDVKETYRSGTFEVSPEKISEGWFYTNQQPSSTPAGWYYSPVYSLYFNFDGMGRLNRFFSYYLGDIPFLVPSVTAHIKVNQFFRMIIEPNTNIAFVNFTLPENVVLAYQKIIPEGAGKRIYVLYMTSPAKQNFQMETIQGKITYKDGKTEPLLYKIRYVQ